MIILLILDLDILHGFHDSSIVKPNRNQSSTNRAVSSPTKLSVRGWMNGWPWFEKWFPHDIFSLFPMIFPYSQYFPIINYFPMLFRQFSSDFPFISPWCSFDVPLLSDIFSHDQTLSLRGNASARVSRGRLRSAMPWSSSDWAKLL